MTTVAFTSDQLKAVDVGARLLDACVVAGPGSGKTTVLVEYFRRLVAGGADPLRILAITFTEKAAGNMRKKLASTFQEDAAIRARLERAWVSTVHGFCARLLRENAIFAGVDPEFYVADERESWRLQQESVADAMSELFDRHREGVRALIRGLSSPKFDEAVLSAYDAMRGAGKTVEEVAACPAPGGNTRDRITEIVRSLRADPLSGWQASHKLNLQSLLEQVERVTSARTPLEELRAIEDFSPELRKCKSGSPAYQLVKDLKKRVEELTYASITDLYSRERELLLSFLRSFDSIYRGKKRAAGALDFADLEECAVRLLEENPETKVRLQAQFDHILMDEFQDTNGQQARLLELVRRFDRFYAVGDINQSIFGFRHAEPEVFREYRAGVEAGGRRLVALVENFRSREEILRAVETVSHEAAGIERRQLVAARQFTDQRPNCVEVIAAPDLAAEAGWIGRRILELLAEASGQFAFRDVAVLVRNTEVLTEFGTAFDQARIPYVVNRGRGFYESREVRDLSHLLRIIANRCDEVSLAAVLRSPLVQVSDEALLQLKRRGDNLGIALGRLTTASEAEFHPQDFSKLTRFRQRLDESRMRRHMVSFDRLLTVFLDDCGYPADSRVWANVDKFLGQARAAAARMSLDEFVDELDQVRDSDPREPDAPPEDSTNAVNVMTVHSAKGLEFPIVFVAAMHKGIDTHPPVVAFSRHYGLGARWRNPASGKDKDDLFQHAIRAERKQREEEESNRLLYVAMTRAEQHLVLSFSGEKPRHWAQHVCDRLHLDVEHPRDEIVRRSTADGREWNLRVVVADHGPELIVNQNGGEDDSPVRQVNWLESPAVTEQYQTNATVTEIAAYARCPRAYYLGHYLGLEGRVRALEDRSKPDAGEFGTLVHKLLAGASVQDADPNAFAMAEVFRESALGKRTARATRIEREFDFLMALEGLVLRGQIDLWFEEGGELVVVDYKTDAVNSMEAHQRASDYSMQLRLYALAVERILGRSPDRAYVHFLRPNTAIQVDLTPSLLDAPEQMVRDFRESQNAMTFPLQEGSHCKRCGFYADLCPAGRREAD
jgi:ATP-dependent exoDNAse (exonuclease V) beta subunit